MLKRNRRRARNRKRGATRMKKGPTLAAPGLEKSIADWLIKPVR
jgi:hypothetical protein